MFSIVVNEFAHWREQARELLRRNIHPDRLSWRHNKQHSLFGEAESQDYLSLAVQEQTPTISRDFLHLAEKVACYRDDDRWALLYSVAWRLVFEDRNLLGCAIDSQVSRLLAMRKAVGRDKHKMEAFVRFRSLDVAEKDHLSSAKIPAATTEYFVAWFEPEHLIVPLVTPFFVKRFHNMNWSILTPDACVHWNQEQVLFTEGATKPMDINDELEELWKEYYANIFNPARLKLKAMQSEMPKKYWINLPEAPLIAELTRTSGQRTDTMISKGSSARWRKTAKSRYVQACQKKLRERHCQGE